MNIIIIADDEDMNLKILKKLITLNGLGDDCLVMEANNGVELVAIYKAAARNKYPVHAVIADFNMPQRNGLVAIQELRELGATMPCYILTANDTLRDTQQYGVTNVYYKPLSRAMVREMLPCLVKPTCQNFCKNEQQTDNGSPGFICSHRSGADGART